jgi:hypothetical protein
MKNSRTMFFLIAGILLSLVFLAGCVLPHQILPVPAKQSMNLQNLSDAAFITLDDANWSAFKQFPPEIRNDIWDYAEKYSIPFVNWGFDPVNDEIDLSAYDFHDTNAINDLNEKKIGNYTIHIFNETELKKEESVVRAYFTELGKKPEYQIDNINLETHSGRSYITLYYNVSTTENQKIQNSNYKGWKVITVPRINPVACGRGFIAIGEECLNVSHAMNS